MLAAPPVLVVVLGSIVLQLFVSHLERMGELMRKQARDLTHKD